MVADTSNIKVNCSQTGTIPRLVIGHVPAVICTVSHVAFARSIVPARAIGAHCVRIFLIKFLSSVITPPVILASFMK
jgi:hypothetical protein